MGYDENLYQLTQLVLNICWLLLAVLFGINAIKVQRARVRGPASTPQRRAPHAQIGTAIQGIGLTIAWFTAPGPFLAPRLIASLILSPASVLLSFLALGHLGDQWRIQAVVTRDHLLITTGPYATVRHPVYLAILLALLATVLARGSWPLSLVAVALYILGTEIRVRAEDGLLAARFGAEFARYKARVPAYIPFIR